MISAARREERHNETHATQYISLSEHVATTPRGMLSLQFVEDDLLLARVGGALLGELL